MTELLNVRYSKYYEKERIVDFFIPEELKSDKCIFFIHGGGFNAGKKDAWHPLARWFCEKGYFCASMEYRLAPGEMVNTQFGEEDCTNRHFPAQIEDVRLCMSFIKENSSKYGFDKNKIIITGSSAGAYLCGMLATIQEDDLLGYTPEMNELDTTPMAVVLYCPVVDLHYNDFNLYGYETKFCQNFMGKPIEGNERLYDLASPLLRITGKTPPTLVIHALEDKLVTGKAVDMLIEAYNKNNVPIKVVYVEGAKHGFGYNTKTEQQIFALGKMYEYIVDFNAIK